MTTLWYVPAAELHRARTLEVPAAHRAALFATLCRINTLYMIMRAGSGHLGTSFSSLDILSWLFLEELEHPESSEHGDGDIFFSSKGHDAPGKYAVLIGLELLDFDLLHKLRRLGGLPGHPDVGTPHMHTNTGSLGMGVSKARGMARARRLLGRTGRLFVLTGDGELQEGQFWESLQPTANGGFDEITVIIDHNKIQSDIWVEQVSSLGALEAKLQAFGWYVARCDGHDFVALQQAFECLRNVVGQPKILIADTVKGKGVSFMEGSALQPGDRLYRFHSGAPTPEDYTRGVEELIARANKMLAAFGRMPLQLEAVPCPERPALAGTQRMVSAYGQALVAQAEANPRIVALDADLALDTGLLAFEERFPERFVECGIAEQDMVSQAGAMALQGLLPICHSFACFMPPRANEQIYNNATERTKVIYVGSLAGLLPGGPGHSHQSVRDIDILAAVPGMAMIEPCCEQEVGLALDYLLNRHTGSGYLRLVSIPCRVPYRLPEGYRLEPGQGAVLREGDAAVVIGYGPVLLPQAWEAARLLAERGIGLKVVNLPWLNLVDREWLRDVIAGCSAVFTLDNHYVTGGQGEHVAAAIAGLGLTNRPVVTCFGVEEIPLCGTNDEVLVAHRLDAASLAERMMSLLV
ncbi:MAG: transketolase [Chloroflexi bacterium OHK40]